MMEQALLELIEMAKSAAPELWEIARAQVEANIWGNKILIWVLGIVGLVLFVTSIVGLSKVSTTDDDVIGICMFGLMVGLGLVVWCVLLIIKNAKMGMNPDYYAINVLMDLVGH